MANTKVTSRVLADDAVGLAQLNISNDPSNGQALTYVQSSNDLQWATISGGVAGISSSANATAITIDSSGKVGIGTTSPDQPLDVEGAGGIRVNEDGSGTKVIGLRSDFAGVGPAVNVSSNHPLLLMTNNTERVRVDSSGNVGINETSPDFSTFGSNGGGIEIDDVGSSFSALRVNQGSTGDVYLAVSTGAGYLWQYSDSPLILGTNNTERIRFGSAGSTFFNTTSGYGTPKYSIIWVQMESGSQRGISFKASSSTATDNPCLFFNTGGGVCGSISTTYSATAFNTSSDYRLKENVVYDWDATSRLKQLKPCRFNWISDETNTPIDGFLAHEAAEVVPNAVTGDKDATKDAFLDDDGNEIVGTTIEEQVMDYSKLIPLLVKTIQELEARIVTLEDN